mmetsp:Transcript_7025/g.6216  ORF Transcript_7025/g.6216 Transcript_7025/m.6216 type:complete len:401 (+) Transcript_7025:1-1203(+)
MENNNHFHNTNNTKHTDSSTKSERKREQKMQAKETANAADCTTNNNKETTGNGHEGAEEEEEEEETATSSNTTTFKRVKTTENSHFENFETTSTSNHFETDGDQTSSQGFDVPLPGTALSSNTNCRADEFIPIGERLISLYKGTLISKEAQNGRGGSKGLRFKCSNNHEFTISFSKLAAVPTGSLDLETCKNIWCVKCHNFFYRCNKKATDNGAVVTSKIFDTGYVNISCRNNHNFKISIHRNPDKVWCQKCKKNIKNECKHKKNLLLKKKNEEYSENQKKLFEESRKHLQTEQTRQDSERRYSVQDILTQVDLKAKYETKLFISREASELCELNVYNVYKIIYMPSEILLASFQSLGDGLNSCFRKMAILVHPDKNSHPLSKRAFQKLSQVYMKCQEKR